MAFYADPTIQLVADPPREGGGCLIVCKTRPHVRVRWTLTGLGALVPLEDFSDAAGLASAYLDTSEVSADYANLVTAEVHVG